MKNIIIIPARFHSTRLPGKPLVQISGKSLIFRVWEIAKSVKNIDAVFIATDNHQIQEYIQSLGAQVIMTDPNYPTGTDRVYHAVEQFSQKPEIIINLQGDAVLTPPWIIQNLIDTLNNDSEIQAATLANQLSWKNYDPLVKSKATSKSSGTTVTFDKNYNALYFSKSIIPFVRHKDEKNTMSPIFKHIGIYGYRYPTLQKFVHLEQTPLEKAESLEQLRLLENSIQIKVIPVDLKGRTMWSVDSPEDVKIVEEIINREGELIAF